MAVSWCAYLQLAVDLRELGADLLLTRHEDGAVFLRRHASTTCGVKPRCAREPCARIARLAPTSRCVKRPRHARAITGNPGECRTKEEGDHGPTATPWPHRCRRRTCAAGSRRWPRPPRRRCASPCQTCGRLRQEKRGVKTRAVCGTALPRARLAPGALETIRDTAEQVRLVPGNWE